ncbi:MAG: helix-turn-helix domain-containing protein [Halolamina sp.]
MRSGIRATVSFGSPAGCPVARFSAATGASIDGVSTSVAPAGDVVTEFLADASGTVEDVNAEPVFSYGTATVYRVAHGGACPCACLGEFGCPVHRCAAEDGELTVVFHAEGFDQLQDVMAELRERYTVDVQRLLQPPLSGNPEERLFVNRGKLTDRQLEVLRTAYERGYFDQPRDANATELAEELGISRSTFTEHLVAAQRKLFEDVLDGR